MLSVLNKKIYKLIDVYFNNVNEKKLENGMFSVYYDGLCIKFEIDDDTYNEIAIGIHDLFSSRDLSKRGTDVIFLEEIF
jgi:hypothetical protein